MGNFISDSNGCLLRLTSETALFTCVENLSPGVTSQGPNPYKNRGFGAKPYLRLCFILKIYISHLQKDDHSILKIRGCNLITFQLIIFQPKVAAALFTVLEPF